MPPIQVPGLIVIIWVIGGFLILTALSGLLFVFSLFSKNIKLRCQLAAFTVSGMLLAGLHTLFFIPLAYGFLGIYGVVQMYFVPDLPVDIFDKSLVVFWSIITLLIYLLTAKFITKRFYQRFLKNEAR